MRLPNGIALDAAGNLYIADAGDHRVRRVTPAGVITTVAGIGVPGFSGDNGPATAAGLFSPRSVAVDSRGNLFIADYDNQRVRRVDAQTGIITTIAGNGAARFNGDNRPATQAAIDPYAIAVDTAGNVYIADWLNERIRKVTISSGIISTVAGTGVRGESGDGGPATGATMDSPTDVLVDRNNAVFFSDSGNWRVRRVTPDGVINTVVGAGWLNGSLAENIPALEAALPYPETIAFDANGNLLVATAATTIVSIRRVTNGIISTIAGSQPGFSGEGSGAQTARFEYITDLATGSNDIYVADEGNRRIRRITSGVVNTFAGANDNDGAPATQAFLNGPIAAIEDSAGALFVAEETGFKVRRISPDGIAGTFYGTGNPGSGSNRLRSPFGLAFDPNGNLLVADSGNHRVLRITRTGQMTVFAGRGTPGFEGDGGAAPLALLRSPRGIAVDSQGNVYIADQGNARVRRVEPDGTIRTVVGRGVALFGGDNGPALQAGIDPIGIHVDSAGNLYIADWTNHRVRLVDRASGNIRTIAGVGTPGFAGDGGPATSAQLFLPTGVAADARGNIYIADFGSATLRRVDTQGRISVVAGTGVFSSNRESGPATTVAMVPANVWVAPNGSLLVSDQVNDRVRRLTPIAATQMALASAGGGSGRPGTRLLVSVKVTDAAGNGAADVPVTFQVTSGTATLSRSTASSNLDGFASTDVTLGDTPGPVVITASAPGLGNVVIRLDITAPPVTTGPEVFRGGVVSAGLSRPSVTTLAPNALATVFGARFAPPGTVRRVTAADLVNGRLPTVLSGVCVEVGEVRAPVFSLTEGQVSFQVPDLPAGAHDLRVITQCGSAQPAASNVERVTAAAAAPEFFFFVTTADGRNPVAAVDAVSGAFLAAPGLIPGASFQAARPGQLVSVFLTGSGATDPPIATGAIPASIARVTGTFRLRLNGRDIPADRILYLGIAPQNPGLYQANFYIPEDAPAGDLPIELTVGGAVTPAGAFLTVAR